MPAVSANQTNTPNRTEAWWLSTDDGERLLEVSEDTKIPNAATIKVHKQDHTLANMLRGQLLTDPQVLFAGYKQPHPLEPHFLLKIQTTSATTPVAALNKAGQTLLVLIQTVRGQLASEKGRAELEGRVGGAAGGGGFGGGRMENMGGDGAGTMQGEGFGFGGLGEQTFGGGAYEAGDMDF